MSTIYNERGKLLVHGYVRNIETKFETLNIPREIHDIIYSYQKQYDEWDKENSHPDTNIDENGTRIEFRMSEEEASHGTPMPITAFGKQIISQGVFIWKLKIISIKWVEDYALPYIGIIKHSKENINEYKTRGSWERIGLQLCAGNSGLWSESIYGESAQGAYKCLWNGD